MGLNPVENFVKGKIADVEKKIEAIDADHDGKADVAEIKALVASAKANFEALAAKLTPEDLTNFLNFVNQNVFASKYTPEEVSAAEALIAQGVQIAIHLEGVAATATTALG